MVDDGGQNTPVEFLFRRGPRLALAPPITLHYTLYFLLQFGARANGRVPLHIIKYLHVYDALAAVLLVRICVVVGRAGWSDVAVRGQMSMP